MLIHVHGVFRSGTTALFQALQQDTAFRCYYEPLNPHLLEYMDFLSGKVKTRKPPTKKVDLYDPFLMMEREIRSLFKPSFAYDSCGLDEDDEAGDLEAYLRFLAHSTPAVLLQFNRAFWMSRWLHKVFPDSYFVHIIRDPRAVAWSQLRRNYGVSVKVPIIGSIRVPWKNMAFSRAVLSRFFTEEYFRIGERLFAERLAYLREAKPFVRLMALWGLQVDICHRQARKAFGDRYCMVRYEDFCTEPLSVVERIYTIMERPVPSGVAGYLRENIHAERLKSWCFSRSARRNFDRGLGEAGIVELAGRFGYVQVS